MGTWIDFKELRATLKIGDVLKHNGVELKVKGDRATGFCPLKTHEGNRRSPSFSAHLGRGIWQCFGCGAKGNALDLFCRLAGLNPDDPQQIRQAALIAEETFGAGYTTPSKPPAPPKPSAASSQEDKKASDTRPRVINAPLDFTLKNLDGGHPYLGSRGFTMETITHFGLGFCGRGMLAGRIAIPLHDDGGHLVGYAGRIVDDSAIDGDHPKYLLPSERERNGAVYEFRKSLLLYNNYRILSPVSDLIVVEGFPSTWWLWQCGFPNVVALMGASCSAEQAALIARVVQPEGRVWILTDGDDAGERCSQSLFGLVGVYRFCRRAKLPAGKQPTDCVPKILAESLSTLHPEGKELVRTATNDRESAD